MDKIFFSENNEYYAEYHAERKMIMVFDFSDISNGSYTGIENIETAERVARDVFQQLSKNKYRPLNKKELMHRQIIEEYKNNPTPETQEKIRFLLLVLKKMSSVNRKIYRVNCIIGEIEDLGIKIKKDYNPFE